MNNGKLKMTKKNILYFGQEVINIDLVSCKTESVLKMFLRPMGYNAGVYGWNYDVYDLGFCIVLTGYRNKFEYVRDSEKHEKIKEFLIELGEKFGNSNDYKDGEKVKAALSEFEKSL